MTKKTTTTFSLLVILSLCRGHDRTDLSSEVFSDEEDGIVAIGQHDNVGVLPVGPPGNHVTVPLRLQYAIKVPLSSLGSLAGLPIRAQGEYEPPPTIPLRPALEEVPVVEDLENAPFSLFWYLPLHPVPDINDKRFLLYPQLQQPQQASLQSVPQGSLQQPYVLLPGTQQQPIVPQYVLVQQVPNQAYFVPRIQPSVVHHQPSSSSPMRHLTKQEDVVI